MAERNGSSSARSSVEGDTPGSFSNRSAEMGTSARAGVDTSTSFLNQVSDVADGGRSPLPTSRSEITAGVSRPGTSSSMNEPFCRICYCPDEGDSNPLTQLGCVCKGDMSLVHVSCAKKWYHRCRKTTCEICGEECKLLAQLEPPPPAAEEQYIDIGLLQQVFFSYQEGQPGSRGFAGFWASIFLVLTIGSALSLALYLVTRRGKSLGLFSKLIFFLWFVAGLLIFYVLCRRFLISWYEFHMRRLHRSRFLGSVPPGTALYTIPEAGAQADALASIQHAMHLRTGRHVDTLPLTSIRRPGNSQFGPQSATDSVMAHHPSTHSRDARRSTGQGSLTSAGPPARPAQSPAPIAAWSGAGTSEPGGSSRALHAPQPHTPIAASTTRVDAVTNVEAWVGPAPGQVEDASGAV